MRTKAWRTLQVAVQLMFFNLAQLGLFLLASGAKDILLLSASFVTKLLMSNDGCKVVQRATVRFDTFTSHTAAPGPYCLPGGTAARLPAASLTRSSMRSCSHPSRL